MVASATPTISVERISIPRALPAFMHSLIGLPNDPASLYISVDSRNLVIYVEPTSTVNVVDLSHLTVALHQKDESALALKTFLEIGPTIKVFFDARMPARTLFHYCNIKLATETCTKRSYVHEVQMMEVALRQRDTDREWLASFDKCITRDLGVDFNKLISRSLDGNVGFDKRILHLPFLWKKYHDQLASHRVRGGMSFWVAMIRNATQKRLGKSRGEDQDRDTLARSGWDKDIIDEQCDSWNDDVMMDDITGGEFLGGAEHWAKYDVL